MIKLTRVTLSKSCERPEGRNGMTVDSLCFSAAHGYDVWEDSDTQRVFISKDGKTIWTPFANVIRAEPVVPATFDESNAEQQRRGPGRPRKYPLTDEA